MTTSKSQKCILYRYRQKGATTVEYAFIVVAMVLALALTVNYLVNPNDPDNSLLPSTYGKMGERVGNFQIKNIPTN